MGDNQPPWPVLPDVPPPPPTDTRWTCVELPRGYQYRIPFGFGNDKPHNLILEFTGMTEHRDSLTAMVVIRVHIGHDEPRYQHHAPMWFGTKNLLGPRTRADLLKAIYSYPARPVALDRTEAAVEFKLGEILWDCYSRTTEGPEPVDLLAPTDRPTTMSPWLLRGLVMASSHTRFIAAGGLGKSLFSMAVALTVATGHSELLTTPPPRTTGPVAYLDWEDDEDTHRDRVKALCRGADLDPKRAGRELHYYAMTKRYSRIATSMASSLQRRGCVMAVVDSTMIARGASDGGGAEDTTIALFAGLREAGIPFFLVDHKTKERAEKGQKGGYGSIATHNSVRLEWDTYQTVEGSRDGRPWKRWRMENTKHNNVAKQDDRYYEVEWEVAGDVLRAVRFAPLASLYQDMGLDGAGTSALDRISLFLLSAQTATATEICEHTGLTAGTFRATVSRHKDQVVKVPASNPARYMLADDPDIRGLPDNIV